MHNRKVGTRSAEGQPRSGSSNGEHSSQNCQLWGGYWIPLQAPETSLEQDNTDGEAESQHSGSEHDEGALWEGSSLGNNGRVDNLNECALLCFIKLGYLELACKDVEDRLVVFHIPQLTDVFETSFGNTPLRHNKFAGGPALRAAKFRELRAHALQFPLCLHHIAVLTGCVGLHSLDLHFSRSDLCAESRCRFDQGTCLAIELDHACA